MFCVVEEVLLQSSEKEFMYAPRQASRAHYVFTSSRAGLLVLLWEGKFLPTECRILLPPLQINLFCPSDTAYGGLDPHI